VEESRRIEVYNELLDVVGRAMAERFDALKVEPADRGSVSVSVGLALLAGAAIGVGMPKTAALESLGITYDRTEKEFNRLRALAKD
jgi:hypothetical protein